MNKSIIYITILFSIFLLKPKLNSQKAIINKPVVDLRLQPTDPPYSFINPNSFITFILHSDNPLQDTQLLLNEKIEILEENNEWIKILAIEQKKYDFSQKKWGYHCGWIKKNDATLVNQFQKYDLIVKKSWVPITKQTNSKKFYVSIGTKFIGEKISINNIDSYVVILPDKSYGIISADDINEINKQFFQNDLRNKLKITSREFFDTPYSWGGRSGYKSDIKHQTGVDCSTLINLIYRVNGIDIPRDAKHQFIACKQIDSTLLKYGDLIFLADQAGSIFADPVKINHVMMYFSEGLILESTGKFPALKTHMVTIEEKLGKKLTEIRNGDLCKQYYVFFGTILE